MHAFQERCNDNAACNCALGARIGDDVVVFDACAEQKGTLVLKMFINGKLTRGTSIIRYSSQKYEVCNSRRVYGY